MSILTHRPETDLLIPVEGAEHWDPHTIHTHYFGFTIPQQALGAFIYLRYQPVFKLVSGGVCIFCGMENYKWHDITHLNYVNTMPYPEVNNGVIKSANGLRVEFPKPGSVARISYKHADCEFDITQTAVTALLARGHVMPGEDDDTDPSQRPGGSEQFTHCKGTLRMGGEEYAIDCHAIRDRSWRQQRTEGEVVYPPVGWSPMYFGEDLIFNQISFEPAVTNPAWAGLYDIPEDTPSHHYAWVIDGGEVRKLTRVVRNVLEYHPDIYAAQRQQIEAEDETGKVYHFEREAIAMAHLPSWPNGIFVDSVYRWTTEDGRQTHCTYQEAWCQRYQRAMTQRKKP